LKRVQLSHKRYGRLISNNLGLHCHCSEKEDKFLALLKKAQGENVRYLVINNYRNLRIYTQILPRISREKLEEYKDIKLIPSIEMPACFNFTNTDGQNYNMEVHLIGYGVDIGQEELLDRFCEAKYSGINQEEELARLIRVGHEIGLHFDDKDAYLDVHDDKRKYAGRAFMQALLKNIDDNFCQEGETNLNKLPYDLRSDWRGFYNVCIKNLNGPFYYDVASLNPDVSEVIDLIHQMGGKAYLVHPLAYFGRDGEEDSIQNTRNSLMKFAEDFMSKYSPQNSQNTHIDGFEIYHPSYLGDMEVIGEMKELVKKHRIGSSGGTDIHMDETLGEHETISSDSLGGKVTQNKIRKFRMLRKRAVSIMKLHDMAIKLNEGKDER